MTPQAYSPNDLQYWLTEIDADADAAKMEHHAREISELLPETGDAP